MEGKRISLDGKWSLSFTLPENEKKIDTVVSVPCNVEPYLVELGLLEDYYPTENAYATQRFEAVDDWTYTTEFSIDEAKRGYTRELVFEGIDTIAEVYLNGERILDCNNMHIAYRTDVTDKLKAINELRVVIRSSELWAREHLHDMFATAHDAVSIYDSQSHLRKARHQWGWDNAPRLITSGIIRSVYIEELPLKRFSEVYLYTEKITDTAVLMGANWCYKTDAKIFTDHKIRLSVLDEDNIVYSDTRRANFVQGTFKYSLSRDTVELWWPAGFGAPKLYTVRLEMLEGDVVSASFEAKQGIRTIFLDRTDDVTADDGRFQFTVNNEPVFIRGANWKPLDPLASVADVKTREGRALNEVKALNCNMVRVWGGGIYEDSSFFDYCDENGLLVWQDFMFACEVPPFDDEYCHRVSVEAEHIVKRYRNHTSLAVWCGDNEDDEALTWTMLHTNALPSDMRVSRKILSRAVLANDPYRNYVPSSPVASDNNFKDRKQGNWNNFHAQTENHFYCELTEQKRELRKGKSIFLGETGPFWGNAIIANDSIWEREAARMERLWDVDFDPDTSLRRDPIFHQDDYYTKVWMRSCKNGCKSFFGKEFSFAEFKDFTLATNVICAEVFKDLIEYCRVMRPSKSGVIWWSLMDMWPMLFNYSVIDYEYNRKLAYYWIQKSQQEFAIMGVRVENDGELALYAANDTLNPKRVEYTVTSYDTDLRARTIASGICEQKKNSTSLIQRIAEPEEAQMWIIRWVDGESVCYNHVFTGMPSYETMREWVRILERQLDIDGHFTELEWLDK